MPVEPSTRIYSWSGVNLVVMAGLSTGFGFAEIAMGHEWRGDHFGRLGAAADRHLQLAADIGMIKRHETECYGLSQRRSKAAAGDNADGITRCIEDLSTLAGRSAF